MSKSEYSKCYEKFEKLGLDHQKISNKLRRIARGNQVDGVEIAIRDSTGRIDRYDKYCGRCNTKLETRHFFAEQTNYSCFLWYKCPKCHKYNFYSE